MYFLLFGLMESYNYLGLSNLTVNKLLYISQFNIEWVKEWLINRINVQDKGNI